MIDTTGMPPLDAMVMEASEKQPPNGKAWTVWDMTEEINSTRKRRKVRAKTIRTIMEQYGLIERHEKVVDAPVKRKNSDDGTVERALVKKRLPSTNWRITDTQGSNFAI